MGVLSSPASSPGDSNGKLDSKRRERADGAKPSISHGLLRWEKSHQKAMSKSKAPYRRSAAFCQSKIDYVWLPELTSSDGNLWAPLLLLSHPQPFHRTQMCKRLRWLNLVCEEKIYPNTRRKMIARALILGWVKLGSAFSLYLEMPHVKQPGLSLHPQLRLLLCNRVEQEPRFQAQLLDAKRKSTEAKGLEFRRAWALLNKLLDLFLCWAEDQDSPWGTLGKKLLSSQHEVCIVYTDGHALEYERTFPKMDLDQEPAITSSCEAWCMLGNMKEKESLTY